MKSDEIYFMRYYIALLYEYGCSRVDVSENNLKDYLNELKKVMKYYRLFERYNNLEDLFEKDYIYDNYAEFITLILYVTSSPKYSFYNIEREEIELFISEEELTNMLTKKNNFYKKEVDEIAGYMMGFNKIKQKK